MSGFVRRATPTAHYQWRCDDCGARIVKGETYFRTSTGGGGTVWDWLDCLACGAMARDVWAWWGNDFGFEVFAEWVDAHLEDPRAIAWLQRIEASR